MEHDYSALWKPAHQALAAMNLPEAARGPVSEVAKGVMLGLIPDDEFVTHLVGEAELDLDLAMDVYDRVYDAAWPTWQAFWQQLEAEYGSLPATLVDRFEAWSRDAEAQAAAYVAEVQSSQALSLPLERALAAKEQWRTFAILRNLAGSGRLVGVALQNRSIRDGFMRWVDGALASRGKQGSFTLPDVEQWNAPMVALLLEYLLQVQLGWEREQAALAAMSLGQLLAHAKDDHSYATVVFGDEARAEFEWRPVRVVGGRVEFSD